VKATSLVVVALMAAGMTAFAQERPSPPDPEQVETQSVPGAPVASQRAAPSVDSRRDDIRAMESLLTRALQKGAADLASQMQVSEPGTLFVTGAGRARGFVLEGYGVFFDVDVPGMRQSVVWSAQMLQQAQQRESLRDFIARSPDSKERRYAEMELRRLDRLGQAVAGPPVPQPAPSGVATAQAVNESATVAAAPPTLAPPVPVAPAAPRAADMRDPNELYTDAVKIALIDTMLKYSAFLKIGAEEWLTVAARDSDGPLMPGQIDDSSTIVLRVKGSDLAAFQGAKLTREEVLKRVVVKEF
jgi:hypothetical protein